MSAYLLPFSEVRTNESWVPEPQDSNPDLERSTQDDNCSPKRAVKMVEVPYVRPTDAEKSHQWT